VGCNNVTRRTLLQTVPAIVGAPFAASNPDELSGKSESPAAQAQADRVISLANQLSMALGEHNKAELCVTVYPADEGEPQIAFGAVNAMVEAADNVSPYLVQAICEHCAAFSALRRASRQIDEVVLGRVPSAGELTAFDNASTSERKHLLAVCRFPVNNDPERFDKASYLLAHIAGVEPAGEFVTAMLEATIQASRQKQAADRL